jgi:thiol-disulfide isomerase/thioredoxin
VGGSSNLKCASVAILFLLASALIWGETPKPASVPTVGVAHLDSPVGRKISSQWVVDTGEQDEEEPKKPVLLSSLFGKNKLIVLLFLSPRDPATLAAADRIKKLAEDYADKPVTFIGLSVNRNESLQELKNLHDKADWHFRVVRDTGQNITRGLDPRFTPEVMVIQSGVVRYAGPLDDNWYDARLVKHRYVRQVLDALLKGKSAPQLDDSHHYGGRRIQ